MLPNIKIIRVTTVPISLKKLIAGQMNFMTKHGFEVSMVSSDFAEKAQLEIDENSTFIPVNMKRAISVLNDLRSLFQLISVFRKIKPSIVHTHTPKAGLLGMVAARFCNVPIRLHTVAGLPLMETSGFKRKILEITEKITYRCANKVYPNSNNLKEFIIANNFCKSHKLKVIGNGSSNGIDTTYFKLDAKIANTANELKRAASLSESDFIFIFIGRLVGDKGIEELVTAFHELSKKHPSMRLLLVGPYESELDPLSKACKQKIENNKSIIEAGYQEDVRPYLAMANVLVFPSYREGFPNVPMQAGCFDLPSVVTNINGCNEIIENEMNGLIVPPKDIISLTIAMERLMENGPLYEKLKNNARKMIVERYEQTYFWSLLLDEYKKQLKGNGIVS